MPWYNDQIKGLKRDRRKADRPRLQRRGDPIKMKYIEKNIDYCATGRALLLTRQRWNIFLESSGMCWRSKETLPNHQIPHKTITTRATSQLSLIKSAGGRIWHFFVIKVQIIRTKLDSQDPEPITIPRVPLKEDMFLSFQPLSQDGIRTFIKQSPNKQCRSDPIPTWLLKECLDSPFPILTL